jgi:hypothetical protein
MIEYIEGFKPKLHIEALGDFEDGIVLEQGQAEVRESGPVNDVAPSITTEDSRNGKCKATQVDVV